MQAGKALSGQAGTDSEIKGEVGLTYPVRETIHEVNDSHSAAELHSAARDASKGETAEPPVEELPVKVLGPAASKDAGGKYPAEDQLAANSAGSTASRHGGSMYDIIVQVMLN